MQALYTALRRVAGNQSAVDGANGRAHRPIRLNACFVYGLVHPQLIGAKRTTVLKYQDDLAVRFARLAQFRCGGGFFVVAMEISG